MIGRYFNRTIYKNNLELYKELFEQRGINFINQYGTPNFTFPDADQINSLNIIEHVWSPGDRFFKLSYKYYGDVEDWWIIAKFNNTPTESHVKLGDILMIPTPLYQILKIMK